MADRLHLLPRHRRILEALIQEHLPGVEVWAYGSRVNGRSHDGSDLDLVLRAPGLEEVPIEQLEDFDYAIRESRIPFLVEARDWARLPERFHPEIEREYVVLAERVTQARWRKVTLGEITDLSWGDTKTTKASYTSAGFPAYSATGQDGFLPHHDFDHTGVVLSAIGAQCGRTWLAKGKWSCIKNTIRFWSTSSDAETEFLYWLTRDPDFWPKRGSAQAFISQGDARAIRIGIPPIGEQRAIAHVLGTLDDRIELNRRMNETLEAMARALFKSWFVDFDPVRAKMEGRDPGLPKDIADLFPDRLTNSELGDIPDGWEVVSLADVAVLRRRGIDPASVARDTPYIGLADMPRGSISLTGWGRASSVSSTKSAFKTGDILFGKLRPYFHKVGIAPVDGLCSTDIVVLNAPRPWSAFALAWVSSSEFVAYASQTSTGTKMPRTNWKAMSEYKLSRPTDAVATAFQHVVSPVFGRIVAKIHESRTLAALRDTLLPKLISGEIRVPDAETALEREL